MHTASLNCTGFNKLLEQPTQAPQENEHAAHRAALLGFNKLSLVAARTRWRPRCIESESGLPCPARPCPALPCPLGRGLLTRAPTRPARRLAQLHRLRRAARTRLIARRCSACPSLLLVAARTSWRAATLDNHAECPTQQYSEAQRLSDYKSKSCAPRAKRTCVALELYKQARARATPSSKPSSRPFHPLLRLARRARPQTQTRAGQTRLPHHRQAAAPGLSHSDVRKNEFRLGSSDPSPPACLLRASSLLIAPSTRPKSGRSDPCCT